MTQPADLTPTPLVESALRMHETYLALCEAGFSEDQALRLVALIVRPGAASSDDPQAPGEAPG